MTATPRGRAATAARALRSSPTSSPRPRRSPPSTPAARRAHRLRDLDDGRLDRRPGPAAPLSTNHVHRTVDSTHAGLLEDERARSRSVHAITEVVTAVRTGTPLDHAMTAPPGHDATRSHHPDPRSSMSHTDRPRPHRRPRATSRPQELVGAAGRRPGRPGPRRPRHLGRQHRPARPSGAPRPRRQRACSGWSRRT